MKININGKDYTEEEFRNKLLSALPWYVDEHDLSNEGIDEIVENLMGSFESKSEAAKDIK